MLRMRSATPGREVRNSVSVQPVQSWKCSQITGGRCAFRRSAATSPAHAFLVIDRPIGATIISSVQNFRKSRRGMPARRSCSPMVEVLFSSCLTISRSLRQKMLVQTNVRISGRSRSVLSGRAIAV